MAKNRAAEKAAEQILRSVIPEEQKQKTPFLENRPMAIILCVAVILLATVFGAHRSVAQQAQKIERKFSTGVEFEGYSIAGDLADRMEYARNLTKIAQRYDLSAQVKAVQNAVAQLDAAQKIAQKYDANIALSDAVDELNGAMLHASLSEQDESYRLELYRNFVSCNDTISHEASAYNRLVYDFNNKTLDAFLTGTLAKLTGVRHLEAFE